MMDVCIMDMVGARRAPRLLVSNNGGGNFVSVSAPRLLVSHILFFLTSSLKPFVEDCL